MGNVDKSTTTTRDGRPVGHGDADARRRPDGSPDAKRKSSAPSALRPHRNQNGIGIKEKTKTEKLRV